MCEFRNAHRLISLRVVYRTGQQTRLDDEIRANRWPSSECNTKARRTVTEAYPNRNQLLLNRHAEVKSGHHLYWQELEMQATAQHCGDPKANARCENHVFILFHSRNQQNALTTLILKALTALHRSCQRIPKKCCLLALRSPRKDNTNSLRQLIQR